jgi:MarR family transcriptional regulator, 2-MHQ and catechol-resistance regulon repressor
MGTHYPGTPREQRALSVYIKLMRASEAVTSRINSHLRDHGLTVSQFGVMEAIYHLGPMNQGDLARKILKSSGNLTTVIDNLSRQGLVERCRREEDRRTNTIYLTPKGQQLIKEIFPHHVQGVVETFAVLTDEEQTTLDRLLRKLGKAAADS